MSTSETPPLFVRALRIGGIVLVFALMAVMLAGRFRMANHRAAQAVDGAIIELCRLTVDLGDEEEFARGARDAVRRGPADPYALFLFQLSRVVDEGPEARQANPLPDGEVEMLDRLVGGEFEVVREEVVDRMAEGSMLDGRGELWLRMIGDVEVERERDCAEAAD